MEEEGTQLEVSKHLSSAKSQARSQAATVSHQRFTPGNNNTRRLRHSSRTSYHILFSILLICFLPLCSASLLIEDQLVEPPPPTVEHEHVEEESLGSAFDRLAKSGIILVDQSPPPTPLDWTLATLAEDLRRRQVGDVPAATSSKHISSITPTPTSSSGGIATATLTQSMSPLPSPFDGGFSSNITATCSAFMNNMLGNSSFQQCLPFSLLLQVSFFSFSIHPPNSICTRSDIHKTELDILLSSRKISRSNNPNPRRDLRCECHLLYKANDKPRNEPHPKHRMRSRLYSTKPPNRRGRAWSPGLQAHVPSILPKEPQHECLLLRRCHHQYDEPER